MVTDICPLTRTDIWINGGFFVMRNEIFRYIQPGDELVREPFQRLIDKQALLAYKYTGFWQCMDTFKDKQRLEELNQGAAPWKVWNHGANGTTNRAGSDIGRRMIQLNLDGRHDGSAADSMPGLSFRRYRNRLRRHDPAAGRAISGLRRFTGWCSAPLESGRRRRKRAAELFAGSARLKGPLLKTFPDGFMPFVGAEVKAVFEELKQKISPDLIFTHNRRMRIRITG